MDFEQTNNGVENTPEPENQEANQETVETPVEATPEKSGNAVFAQFADKAKELAKELAKDERVAKGVEKVKKVPKKTWLTIAIAVAVLIVGYIAIGFFTNTYKTPMNLVVSFINDKTHSDPIKDVTKLLNGFADDEINAIIKILKKSDDYEDMVDGVEETFDKLVETLEKQFGDNYKCSFKVEEKEKLDKDDCKKFKKNLKQLGEMVEQIVEKTEDYDSDDWEDMAEEIGISKSNAKKLVKHLEDLEDELKDAKVTKGYELQITTIIKGSKLDEPEENEMTINVYKVNGRWFLDIFSMGNLGGLGNLLPF